MRHLSLTSFAKKMRRLPHKIQEYAHYLPGIFVFLAGISVSSGAMADDTRVLWKLGFDDGLSGAEKNEVESTVIKTLGRASERHFVGRKILEHKLRTEGLNFPECFTDGVPCAAGGSFVLDVYNVDAYASAQFSRSGNEWVIDLTLYRRLSGSAMKISRSGPGLSELLQTVLGSLFDMESEMEIQCRQQDVGIYVNNRLVGTAPMTMRIPVGAQSVTFKKSGYVSQTWEFTAEKGNLYTKNVELIPEVTQLTVLTTAPDAQITVDGEPFGPANAAHDILPGDHHILVAADGYNSFEQDYKVYPGNPQTIQTALLPVSASPYEVRHHGISSYHLSAGIGYDFKFQKMSMLDAKVKIGPDGIKYHPERKDWADGIFNGLTIDFNYEGQYWGISIFKFDLAFASFGKNNVISMAASAVEPLEIHPEEAMLIAFYPAVFKAHYTFWVMQAEAAFGVGLTHLAVDAKYENSKISLKDTAFSINFGLGLKYYFTEETYLTLGYELQYDVADDSSARHGFMVGLGMQFVKRSDSDSSAEVPDPVQQNDAGEGDVQAETAQTTDNMPIPGRPARPINGTDRNSAPSDDVSADDPARSDNTDVQQEL